LRRARPRHADDRGVFGGAGYGEAAGVALVAGKQFGEIVVRKNKMFDLVFDEAGGIKQNR